MAVGLEPEDYRRMLFQLLPPGMIWPTDPESNVQRLLSGLAQELYRVDSRVRSLLLEADPRRASELFPEWESSFGLPDECTPTDQSMADRRAALVGRVIGRGGMREEDYVGLAEGLGYDGLEVVEHLEATMELGSGAGPRGAEIGDPLNDETWLYAWDALLPSGVVREAVVGDSEIGDPLRSWGDALIECALQQAAPSWLILIVGYKTE